MLETRIVTLRCLMNRDSKFTSRDLRCLEFSLDLPDSVQARQPNVAVASECDVRVVDSEQYLAYHLAISEVDDRESIWYGRPHVALLVDFDPVRQSCTVFRSRETKRGNKNGNES